MNKDDLSYIVGVLKKVDDETRVKFILALVDLLSAQQAHDANFNEADHPRKGGKFTSGSGGESSSEKPFQMSTGNEAPDPYEKIAGPWKGGSRSGNTPAQGWAKQHAKAGQHHSKEAAKPGAHPAHAEAATAHKAAHEAQTAYHNAFNSGNYSVDPAPAMKATQHAEALSRKTLEK